MFCTSLSILQAAVLRPATEQDAHELVNTQMGLRTDEWSVAVWCRNCTDEQVKEVQFNNPLGLTTPLAHINRPIEIGVTARYNF